MSEPERTEAMARMLCLACGEDPDTTEDRSAWSGSGGWQHWSSPPLWRRKYAETARRLLAMGVALPA